MEKVLTVCPYCGTGCGLNLIVEKGRITGVEPDKLHPVNEGELCLKGYYGFEHISSGDRLTTPLLKKEGRFSQVTWEEALNYTAAKLAQIKKESEPDSFALFASARATNEENYTAQKFARTVMGTNNVDHCARL